MIADKYYISSGTGKSTERLVSFDKALLDAGVGNYNLVKLSSILPAHAIRAGKVDIEEGSILPCAYAVMTSQERCASGVAIGFPSDHDKVGVIMECSGPDEDSVKDRLERMVAEAFRERGWELDHVKMCITHAMAEPGETVTTFACVAEWKEEYGKDREATDRDRSGSVRETVWNTMHPH